MRVEPEHLEVWHHSHEEREAAADRLEQAWADYVKRYGSAGEPTKRVTSSIAEVCRILRSQYDTELPDAAAEPQSGKEPHHD